MYALGNDYDVFIAKYSHSGDFLWAKRYGGLFVDEVYDIFVTDENIYLCGAFSDTLNFSETPNEVEIISQGNSDGFLAKFDMEGNSIWARRMGSDSGDGCAALAVYEDEVYVVGAMNGECNFSTPAQPFVNEINHIFGNADAFLVKFNKDCISSSSTKNSGFLESRMILSSTSVIFIACLTL